MLRFDEVNGLVTPFLHAANFTNGHTLDPQGRVLSCEHLSRSVTRVEHDGSVTVIADAFEGKQLNSPNDVVVASNGAVWFTDPTYGIATEYEGGRIESEIGSRNVYRVATDGSIRAVLTDFVQPNGSPFRRMAGHSMSSTAAASRRRSMPLMSAATTPWQTGDYCANATSASMMASASTGMATSGRGLAMAFNACHRMGRCSAGSFCRKRPPTYALAARIGINFYLRDAQSVRGLRKHDASSSAIPRLNLTENIP